MLHVIQVQKHLMFYHGSPHKDSGYVFSTYSLIFFFTFSPTHPYLHESIVLLSLHSPAVDTLPVKPAGLGLLNQCLRQLWRPLQSTAFKKPLLGTGGQVHFFYRYVLQFHFFYRYVAALGSSALHECPWVFHCQVYYIQSNTNIPKLNSERSVLSCSAASAIKQLCAAFQEMILPWCFIAIPVNSEQVLYLFRSYLYLLSL